jgi:two-component system cell cycle response regulator
MKHPTLLVIDDNEINLALINYMLGSAGCEVCAASQGEQALELLSRRHDFDAILCDIQMPVMDGYAFARRLKADPALAHIPLVALTALAMVGDRERILASGFDAYLSKPIEPASFITTIRSVIPDLWAEPARHTPAQTPSPLTPETAGKTILALDDTNYNLELKRELLQPLGYRVLTASTAAEALRLARIHRPDLIISDVGMHEGTGFDFIAEVKADPLLRDIPFMFLSATHWDEAQRARGLALGALKYLRRPIDSHLLLSEIRRALAAPPRS